MSTTGEYLEKQLFFLNTYMKGVLKKKQFDKITSKKTCNLKLASLGL